VERTIAFTLNGKPARVTVDDDRTLLWVLRGDLGLTGTKFGCGAALCGVCTVIVDGDAVPSCTMPMKDVAGKSVLTIEGLGAEHGGAKHGGADHMGAEGQLHPIQEAFVKHGAFQCGYCTPGMILTTYAFLRKTPRPTREQIIDALDGNLCRCGAHIRILEAVEEAAATMKEGAR